MNMLNETTAVLKQVEETSDIPVEVITDPSLPTYARIKIARGAATHHILTYNPTKPGVDYHIAYQCGFILRLFENSPDERYEFAGTKTGHEVVRELLTKQGGGTPRMDAVMYCLDALEKFDGLTPEQVQAVTLEIAMLGRQGLDTNDPTPKYRLRSLPGEFTGLHLVSLLYVGFEQINPGHDVGFDLSQEYETAQQLFSRKRG
jgi:hypothetical protein